MDFPFPKVLLQLFWDGWFVNRGRSEIVAMETLQSFHFILF